MSRWVTIFAGPKGEALAVEGYLAAEGLPVRIPDRETKAADPFHTGGNALAWHVAVPEAEAAQALELLRSRRAASSESLEPGDEEEADADDDTWTVGDLEGLARRVRWAALGSMLTMGLLAPVAILYGVFYVQGTREFDHRPAGHAYTVASLAIGILWAIGMASWLVVELR